MQEKNFLSKKDDLIQNLINIKKKIELKDIENQKKIKDLEEELENVTSLKDKLQLKFISEENNNPFNNLNEFHENYFEFIDKIKKKAINNKDNELLTICNDFKNQYLGQINNEENKFENKEIQTETYETEIDSIKEKYENEKRILFKTLDEKNENFFELENNFTELKDKYENTVVQINDDQKKLIEKNNILQDNLKQLKNQLTISQTQKSMIETKYEQINKLLIDRNNKIDQLEKEKSEMIEKTNLRSTISPNVIKVIQGGMSVIN
jgi:chromosome segregation protein